MGPAREWRPGASFEVLRARARLLERLRTWFRERGVLEVETPCLSAAAATDPNVESLSAHSGSREVFLHTSPEFPMKRLLAAGSGDIYQLSRVFRGSETGARHNPEFTMLEWYRVGMGMRQMMDDVESVVRYACGSQTSLPRARRVAYRDLVVEVTGLDPLAAGPGEIADALESHGVAIPDSVEPDDPDLLDLLLAAVVEPALDPRVPVFVYHFPVAQAALARVCPSDARVADRFELFMGGMEIANGFHELKDATEQRRRFEADNARRAMLGRPVMPVDERLLAALDAGLPDCSGVALGIDRLLMYQLGLDDIRRVLAFDIDRA